MNKRIPLNFIYLIFGTLCLSATVFDFGDSIWFLAWIGPVFLMRFIRNSKWWVAVVASFIAFQISQSIGMIPFMEVTESSMKMSFFEVIMMQVKSGFIFLVPILMIPFLVDKALYRRLPAFLSCLIYPLTVVALEYLTSLRTGTMNTFGETQFHSKTITYWTSLIGIFGLSFIISLFAPLINSLWEGRGNYKKLGVMGKVYPAIIALLLIYSGVSISFPVETDKSVMISGITEEVDFMDDFINSDMAFRDIIALEPEPYSKMVGSNGDRLDLLKQRILESIEHGAKIIILQEFSFTLLAEEADDYIEDLKEVAKSNGVYLILSYARILSESERSDRPERNMSICLTPEGTIGWNYAKAYPNPGWEDIMIEPGEKELQYIDTPYGRLGIIICADAFYPHYVQQASQKNIDLLIIPAWDTKGFNPLNTFITGLRAVENGLTIVRVAGEGISSVVDPYFTFWARQDTFIQGNQNFYARVPVTSKDTFYGLIGHLFPMFSTIILVGIFIYWFFVSKIKRKES